MPSSSSPLRLIDSPNASLAERLASLPPAERAEFTPCFGAVSDWVRILDSGSEINRLVSGGLGEGLPPVDFSHDDVTNGEQCPEQHGGSFSRINAIYWHFCPRASPAHAGYQRKAALPH